MKSISILFGIVMSALTVIYPVQSLAANPNDYGLPNFAQLVEDTNASVVNISTTKKIRRQQMPQFRGMPDELLRHFFGIPQYRGQPQEKMPEQAPKERAHSLGSGFIISEDGYILTNHHVIDGADEIVVRMRDRKELVAKVIGSDERSDVALLKIEADDLPFAKIGDSDHLKVGQWVLAIGEPFGLDFTATHGIISALGRALPRDTYVPFIQTDVAINPGNSGGPLFNLKGEVIGINSQIYSKTGGSMGLSFSIPINMAMNVAKQLKESGQVARGYLGVQIQEVTSDLAKSFGLKKPRGALVGEAYPDTAAANAGIKAGDIILEFDGKKIEKSTDLPPIVGVSPLDKKLKVKVLRNGKIKIFKVKLNSLEQAESLASNGQSKSFNENRLGATVKNLDSKGLESLKLSFGVLVTNIKADGAADKAGLKRGDVIVSVDFKPVKSARSLEKIINQLPNGRSLPLRVVRNQRSLFLPLVLE